MLLDPKPRFTVEDIPPGIVNKIGELPKALINECTVLTETHETAEDGTSVTSFISPCRVLINKQ
jgi:hypothetical protein